jgi:hypothetical protein
MTAQELKDRLAEAGATDAQTVRHVLEDGAALASLGVTDEDQDAVEALHGEIVQGGY